MDPVKLRYTTDYPEHERRGFTPEKLMGTVCEFY